MAMNNTHEILGPLLRLNNCEEGLEIQWNFHGLSDQRNYEIYHIFLPFSLSQHYIADFIHSYYKVMKFGELIGILQDRQNSSMRKNDQQLGENFRIKWNEKTAWGLDSNFIKKKYFLKEFTSNCEKTLAEIVKKLNGFVVINILMDSQQCQKERKDFISSLSVFRKNYPQMQKSMINIIQQDTKQNYLDFFNGINYYYWQQCKAKRKDTRQIAAFCGNCQFCLRRREQTCLLFIIPEKKINESMTQTINLINRTLKLVVVKKIQVKISLCHPHKFFTHSNRSWKYLQNQQSLQKVYYNMIPCNFKQKFIFIRRNDSQQCGCTFEEKDLELRLTLHCQLHNGVHLQAKNNVEIRNYYEAFVARTYEKEIKMTEIDPLLEGKAKIKVENYDNFVLVYQKHSHW